MVIVQITGGTKTTVEQAEHCITEAMEAGDITGYFETPVKKIRGGYRVVLAMDVKPREYRIDIGSRRQQDARRRREKQNAIRI